RLLLSRVLQIAEASPVLPARCPARFAYLSNLRTAGAGIAWGPANCRPKSAPRCTNRYAAATVKPTPTNVAHMLPAYPYSARANAPRKNQKSQARQPAAAQAA